MMSQIETVLLTPQIARSILENLLGCNVSKHTVLSHDSIFETLFKKKLNSTNKLSSKDLFCFVEYCGDFRLFSLFKARNLYCINVSLNFMCNALIIDFSEQPSLYQ